MLKMLAIAITATLALYSQTAREYRNYVGKTLQLCGKVVTYMYPDIKRTGCAVRLDLGTPYWEPQTYLLVPSQHLASFTIPPEERYVGQHICATGLVQADKDRIAHVVVVSPAQIEIVDERPTPPFGRGAYRACERGVSEPKLRKEVRPSYPSGNLVARKIEDVLLLEAVVGIDGSVTESRTVYGKYPEFHEEAHRAVRQWRFEAGKRDGVRVPVIVQIEMQFVLR